MRLFSRALRACQAPPPSRSSSTLGLLRAVARQQLDVLDRQEQLVAAGVVDFQAVVRRAGRLDRSAGRRSGRCRGRHGPRDRRRARLVDLGDEILGALARARRGRTSRSPRMSCSPMTATSSVSKPDSRPSTASATVGLRQRQRLRPGRRRWSRLVELVVGEHVAQALARALAPQRDDDALAGRLQRLRHASTTASKTLTSGSARSAAKLRPCRAPASIDRAAPSGHGERRQPRQRASRRAARFHSSRSR